MTNTLEEAGDPPGRFSDGVGFVNDQYVPIAEAGVPILDWVSYEEMRPTMS